MNIFQDNPIIAAVKTRSEFNIALKSQIESIFLLNCSIMNISEYIKLAGEHGKKIFIHLDMVEGLGKDGAGIQFVSSLKPHGIISTRQALIKQAKSAGLITVQRFFMVDGQSVETALESIKSTHPDYIEIMPGVIPKLITEFCSKNIKTIAGGLISKKEEVYNALKAGAIAISTSHHKFWE